MAKNRPGNARFCPYCGAASIERDRMSEERTVKRHKTEYICLICGEAWRLDISYRVQVARTLAKRDRQQRPIPEKPAPERQRKEQMAAACNRAFRRIKREEYMKITEIIRCRMDAFVDDYRRQAQEAAHEGL